MLLLENWLATLVPAGGIVHWLFLANYLLAFGFAASEILRSRTAQGSIAWILSLLILPFPMTVIYATFGLKLFDDYAAVQTHSGRVMRKVRAAKTKVLDQPSTEEWPVLANVSQIPFLKGNDVELLIDGEATFKSIFEGISRAQKVLLIQFYIIHDDELGREFAERLLERAAAGVKIYLLYDDVGCFWLPRAYKRRLRDAGILMRGFNHRHRFLRFLGPTRIQYRNHRKIMIADGARGVDRRAQCGRRIYRPLQALRPLARHPCPAQGPGGAGGRTEFPRRLAMGDRRRTDRAADLDRNGRRPVGAGHADRPCRRARKLRHRLRRRHRPGAEAAVDRQPLFRARRRRWRPRSMPPPCAASTCGS